LVPHTKGRTWIEGVCEQDLQGRKGKQEEILKQDVKNTYIILNTIKKAVNTVNIFWTVSMHMSQ
jgi:hypothetical protein